MSERCWKVTGLSMRFLTLRKPRMIIKCCFPISNVPERGKLGFCCAPILGFMTLTYTNEIIPQGFGLPRPISKVGRAKFLSSSIKPC
jgi:hypothetical protein